MPDQSQPHVIGNRPFAVLGDGAHHHRGKLFARKRSQHLRFRQISIVQNDGDDLRVPLREKRASKARRPPPGQGDFLSQRQLRQPRNQLVLRVPFQLRGNSRQKRELHEVHQVKIAQQSQSYEPRRARMKRQRPFDAVILQKRLAPCNFFQNFCREVFSFEQHAKLRFLKRGIVEQREQNLRVGVVKQRRQLVAGRKKGAISIFVRPCHLSSLPYFRWTAAAKPAARQLPLEKRAALQFRPEETHSSNAHQVDSPDISNARSCPLFWQ